MNSRVSWSVDGIEPSVRERAEAAAQRAGMSLSDWLNSAIGEAAPSSRTPAPLPERAAQDVADIHERLDSITRQIDHISRPAPRGEPVAANQLNDAISRLDARLSQLTEQASRKTASGEQQRKTDVVERAATQVYRNSPPINPGSLESAIAEITARQSELESATARGAPPRPPAAAPVAPVAQFTPAPAAGPDFSSLERQLLKITSQIESIQPARIVEESIAAFRNDLAEIRKAIVEAMPRRAIESIENDIRALSRRIDETRQNGIDGNALAGIERALNEIRGALHSLTPAEQLAGYDEAIRNLGGKLDLIIRTSNDPATITQLENAISALRGIVSNVASNDTLTRLSDDLRTLSAKVDQFAHLDGGNSLASLEQRISGLTAALENRERTLATNNSEQFEGALRAFSERLDRVQVGNDGAAAFAHLEQRVAHLLDRLEYSGSQPTDLGRIESGLQDVLRHLERQQSNFSMLASEPRPMPAMDPDVVHAIRRELSDIRFSHSESERFTQDSLEVVHGTLGHVVDRLAVIEGDLRAVRETPPPPPPRPAPVYAEAPRPVAAAQRPELPNPAASQFAAAPRQFAPAAPAPAPSPASPQPATPAIRDLPESSFDEEPTALRLPPDHPLEPGTKPPARAMPPAERELAPEPAAAAAPASASSFIAAARRAAQAAAATTAANDKAPRGKSAAGPVADAKPGTGGSTITSKIRSLLVGASVIIIVFGSFRVAMNVFDSMTSQPQAMIEQPQFTPPAAAPETPKDSLKDAPKAAAPAPAPVTPSMTSPTPIGKQSMIAPQSETTSGAQDALQPSDVTGGITPQLAATVPSPDTRKPTLVSIPAGERLPDAIGGPVLRAAALKGDANAAYEIGMRYAEGRGIPANFDEAFKWYDRSAQAGVVPAIFRLGTLYEKGLSVKKDLDAARRYYIQAAERGNAKAMHNLAVLEADGGGRGANYKSASQWFRKAADRGVADSQFNLGILYARGIGVEQNLAESFKWFSLAAAQGDADAGRKRDDVSKRLDPQSLAAAKLAIQTFVADAQPDDAVNAGAPVGGWDAAPGQTAAAKPVAKRATR